MTETDEVVVVVPVEMKETKRRTDDLIKTMIRATTNSKQDLDEKVPTSSTMSATGSTITRREQLHTLCGVKDFRKSELDSMDYAPYSNVSACLSDEAGGVGDAT